jgi:hypothetical protein
MLVVLVVALLTSLADRLRHQRALLDELFEQAPQAVVLMNADVTDPFEGRNARAGSGARSAGRWLLRAIEAAHQPIAPRVGHIGSRVSVFGGASATRPRGASRRASDPGYWCDRLIPGADDGWRVGHQKR